MCYYLHKNFYSYKKWVLQLLKKKRRQSENINMSAKQALEYAAVF
jgi:hypothetical protein